MNFADFSQLSAISSILLTCGTVLLVINESVMSLIMISCVISIFFQASGGNQKFCDFSARIFTSKFVTIASVFAFYIISLFYLLNFSSTRLGL